MGTVIVFGVIFVVGIGGLILGASLLMNKLLNRTVYERHQALEELVGSGDVPHVWSDPYEAKVEKLAADPARMKRATRLRKRAREHYLAKLDGLVQYLRKTTLVESEETRGELLERLQEIRREWSAD